MDKQDLFRDFDEMAFNAISAATELLQTNVVARDTKAIMKINRFRLWLMQYQDEAAKK